MNVTYQSGFGNTFATEALPGALPAGRNSPQRCPYGLYAEQLSGTAFTAPRSSNRRSWLYRIRPAAVHRPFERIDAAPLNNWLHETRPTPNQLRWDPLPAPERPTDFLEGVLTIAANGDPHMQCGCAVHIYTANRGMGSRVFYDADGELLFVPQHGRHRFITELGVIEAEPQEVVVIPRGVRFRLDPTDADFVRGYLCENFGAAFRLPELGPIGANGLANPRDFLIPLAAYEDSDTPHELIAKFSGQMWAAVLEHSPFDVVAWHGNYAPYKYDLRRFNAMGSISYDHPDPSIFTVLQAPSDTAGVAMIDFVVFAPRILIMQDTFRPPWYHRNIASEFMGLIHGVYEARQGFRPGGASLHNSMSAHGPDAKTFEAASNADLSQPDVIRDAMAFMFETRWMLHPTRQALESTQLQRDYFEGWQALPKRFDPNRL